MIEKLGESPEENPDNSKWNILLKYDKNERQRVDRLKNDMVNGKPEATDVLKYGFYVQERYEREKIDIPPSTIRKFGRTVLDLLRISIPSSEARRDREAMSIAVSERKAEQAAEEEEKEFARQMRRTQGEIARSVSNIMFEEEQEKRDREQLEHSLAETMDAAKYNKHNNLQNERAQELIERDLNNRLLTVDSLEDEVYAGNPEVEKRSVEFEGKEIPIYDLKGIPFSMLSHAIDYRSASWNDPNHIGSQTSQNLLKNPALWAETREQAEQDEGYGTRNGNARGNVISASYINSESNLTSRVGGSDDSRHIHTCYGFSHLDGGSLLNITWGDGGTPNKVSDRIGTWLTPYGLNILSNFEGSKTKDIYNEFLIRRYSETGKPKLPDYIIAQDDHITEDTMRHAKFFNIPIVNIDKRPYQAKFEQRVIDALEGISENSSYEDISSAIDKIKTTSRYNRELHLFKSIGDGSSSRYFESRRNRLEQNGASETSKKLLELEALELTKRPQFIIDEIKKSTEECEKATATGQKYKFSSDVLSSLKIFVYDVNTDTYSCEYPSSLKQNSNTPRACSRIDIEMAIKNSTRRIETAIWDGEHRIEIERYKARNGEDSLRGQDSSTYDALRPIVEAYFAALRTNNAQKHT